MRIGIVTSLLALLMAGFASGSEERLTNEQVIEMVGAGFTKELVIKKIESSNGIFDDSPAALIKLKKSGVPEEIIELMLDQSEKRRKSLRSKINLEIQHLTKDNRLEVRDAAFMYLYQLGPAALPELRRRLGHARPEIRAAVAEALGRMQDKKSADELRLMLVDSVPMVRHAAAEALGTIKDEIALKLARQAVVAGTPPLSGYIHLLGKMKDARSVSIICVRLMENPDSHTRAHAAWALGEIGVRKAAVELTHALIKDRTAEVRAQAATALGKLKVPDTAKSLQQLCRHDSSPARAAALRALGEFPARIAVPFLIKGALLQNKTKLNADELSSVLVSLRKLTHQDLGNDPRRWQLWWQKNREQIESGQKPKNDDSFVPLDNETGKSQSTPMPPPPPVVKLPAKEPVASTVRSRGGEDGVVPHHAARVKPKPEKATPSIRSQDLPDMPPPILPPLPARQGEGKDGSTKKTGEADSRLTRPPIEKKDDEGIRREKRRVNPKTSGDEAPGIFVPDRNKQGLAPESGGGGSKRRAAEAARKNTVESITLGLTDNDHVAGTVDVTTGAKTKKTTASVEDAMRRDTVLPMENHMVTVPGIVEISRASKPRPAPARRKRILLATSDDAVAAPGKIRTAGDRAGSTAIKTDDVPAVTPLMQKKKDKSAQILAREVAAMQGDKPGGDTVRNQVDRASAASPGKRIKKKRKFWRSLFRKHDADQNQARNKSRFSADDYEQD